MKASRRNPTGRNPGGLAGLAGLAALAVVALRLPFAVGRLWDHDSVQFALAVADFDLAAHQPHPPGYPLYVGALKVLATLGVAPGPAMVALSILAQAVGAAFLVLLAARLVSGSPTPGSPGVEHPAPGALEPAPGQAPCEGTSDGAPAEGRPEPLPEFLNRGPVPERGAPRPQHQRPAVVPRRFPPATSRAAAVLAVALYATNPLLWFYGELPLVYAVESGLAVVLAWAALRMMDGRGAFLLACTLFALTGGVRPSTLVLLFPLFLFGLWRARRRLGLATLAAGALLGTVCIAAWLVPLAALAGGLGEYRRISGEHFAALLPYTSVLHGAGAAALAHNLEVLVKWGVQGTVPAVAALLAGWAVAPRRAAEGVRLALSRLPLLLVWVVPPVAFFALFHVTKAGYTLVHLPALLLAAALVAAPAAAGPGARWRRLLVPGVALLAGAGLFLFGADRRPDQPRWLAAVRHEHNRGELAGYERDLDALLAALERFAPEETLLATVELSGTGGAGAEGFLYPYHRHLQWYAPEFPVALLVPEQDFALLAPGGRRDFRRLEGRVLVGPRTRRLVLVLAGPPGERLPLPLAEVVLANPTFRVLALPLGRGIAVGPLEIVPLASEAEEPAAGHRRSASIGPVSTPRAVESAP
ncbi:MAG TPA: hypothetical protein VHQ65_06915 [Thermoanaerobaculia bacterium]|nr:hypothetical protein [Thermoanaerobaculia bacterium]